MYISVCHTNRQFIKNVVVNQLVGMGLKNGTVRQRSEHYIIRARESYNGETGKSVGGGNSGY